jgi:hypothetical protein
VPREHSYSFPAAGLCGFEREGVLNHLLNRKPRLYPGEMIEGSLLGIGEECISDEYHDRQCLVTQFSVYDERGNRDDLRASFMLGLFGPPRRRRSFSGSAHKSRIPVETRGEESCESEEFAA